MRDDVVRGGERGAGRGHDRRRQQRPVFSLHRLGSSFRWALTGLEAAILSVGIDVYRRCEDVQFKVWKFCFVFFCLQQIFMHFVSACVFIAGQVLQQIET